MEPINSFFPPFKCSISSAIFKEKGFWKIWPSIFFIIIKKLIESEHHFKFFDICIETCFQLD